MSKFEVTAIELNTYVFRRVIEADNVEHARDLADEQDFNDWDQDNNCGTTESYIDDVRELGD